MTLQQIADHIWLYPHDPDAETLQPNVGIIITERETVLVDAGSSPRHARQIQNLLNRQGAPPVRYVIYTHHHFDHSFGGQVWDGSTIIAHDQCRKLLLERYGNQPWSGRHLEEQIQQDPSREKSLRAMEKAVGDWVGFKVIPPRLTFSDDLTIRLDGLTLEMRHVGGAHAADSITVRLREDSVLFVGDCYYPPPQGDEETTHDVAMLQALLAQEVALYVEGHNKPAGHDEFARILNQG